MLSSKSPTDGPDKIRVAATENMRYMSRGRYASPLKVTDFTVLLEDKKVRSASIPAIPHH